MSIQQDALTVNAHSSETTKVVVRVHEVVMAEAAARAVDYGMQEYWGEAPYSRRLPWTIFVCSIHAEDTLEEPPSWGLTGMSLLVNGWSARSNTWGVLVLGNRAWFEPIIRRRQRSHHGTNIGAQPDESYLIAGLQMSTRIYGGWGCDEIEHPVRYSRVKRVRHATLTRSAKVLHTVEIRHVDCSRLFNSTLFRGRTSECAKEGGELGCTGRAALAWVFSTVGVVTSGSRGLRETVQSHYLVATSHK